jgi:protein-tyrosine phosphatase
MDDVETEKLTNYIEDGMSFIAKCVDTQQKVTLVHCMEGKSRSVSMVLGYLMKYKEMALLNAYKLCKKKRHIIRPNKAFWKSLMAMEKELFGSNSVTMKTIPSGPKAHICPYCEKNCGTSSKYLAKHVARKHPQETM